MAGGFNGQELGAGSCQQIAASAARLYCTSPVLGGGSGVVDIAFCCRAPFCARSFLFASEKYPPPLRFPLFLCVVLVFLILCFGHLTYAYSFPLPNLRGLFCVDPPQPA
jgi:hypothetical protein